MKQPLVQQAELNSSWNMDFMSDSLASGNRFKTLNVINDYNQEALPIEVAPSISSKRVIRTLEQLLDWRGEPASFWGDIGPESTSADFTGWC